MKNFKVVERQAASSDALKAFNQEGVTFPDSTLLRRAYLTAEQENARRNQRCMDGLDNMVRAGGIPWGASYGYVRTAKPGFPFKDKAQAAAIVRAFSLGVSLSAAQTARVLRREGHISPGGTAEWSARMVSSIWNRETYTGHILYRKTETHRCRKSGKVVSFPRRIDEQMRGFNEALAIVSEDEFAAVAEARRRRRKERHA
jgi:hypothetical protein